MPRGRPQLPPHAKPAPPRGPKPSLAPAAQEAADELIHTDTWFFDPDYPVQFRADPSKPIPGVLHAYGYTYVAKYHAWYYCGNLAPPPYWSMAWIDKNLDVPVVQPYVPNGIHAWIHFRMRLRSRWDTRNDYTIGQMLFMMQRRRRFMEYLLEYEHATHAELRLPFPILDDDADVYKSWGYDEALERLDIFSVGTLDALQPLLTLDNAEPTVLYPRIGKGQSRVKYTMTRHEQLQRVAANPNAVAHEDLSPEERWHQGDWYYALREFKWRGETHGYVDNQPPPFSLPRPIDPGFVPRPGAYRIAPVRSKYLPWKYHDDPRPRRLPWGPTDGKRKVEHPGDIEMQAMHRQVRPIEERWSAPVVIGPMREDEGERAAAIVQADPLPPHHSAPVCAEPEDKSITWAEPTVLYPPTVDEPPPDAAAIVEPQGVPTIAPAPKLATGEVPFTWPHQTETKYLKLFREVAEQHYRAVPEFTKGDHGAMELLEEYARDVSKGQNLDSVYVAPTPYVQSLSGRGVEFILREWFTLFVKQNSDGISPINVIARGIRPPDGA